MAFHEALRATGGQRSHCLIESGPGFRPCGFAARALW